MRKALASVALLLLGAQSLHAVDYPDLTGVWHAAARSEQLVIMRSGDEITVNHVDPRTERVVDVERFRLAPKSESGDRVVKVSVDRGGKMVVEVQSKTPWLELPHGADDLFYGEQQAADTAESVAFRHNPRPTSTPPFKTESVSKTTYKLASAGQRLEVEVAAKSGRAKLTYSKVP